MRETRRSLRSRTAKRHRKRARKVVVPDRPAVEEFTLLLPFRASARPGLALPWTRRATHAAWPACQGGPNSSPSTAGEATFRWRRFACYNPPPKPGTRPAGPDSGGKLPGPLHSSPTKNQVASLRASTRTIRLAPLTLCLLSGGVLRLTHTLKKYQTFWHR